MSDPNESQTGQKGLLIVLDSDGLPVSSVSSMLRVLQAAVREVARGQDETRSRFEGHSQPVLTLSTGTDGGDLNLRLSFADPADAAPMAELSAQAFDPFMTQFANLLKAVPQPGLWGPISRRSGPRQFETEADRRLDELRAELRRFSRATLRFGDRSISFHGDQLEIH